MNDLSRNFLINKSKNIFEQNMTNTIQTSLRNVYPPFIPMLNQVLETKKFGVASGAIELIEVTSSQCNEKGDRFEITIPYAQQLLNWSVIFDSTNPEMGPDFDFHDKTFLLDPQIELVEQFLPSLMEWDPSNQNCLLNVLLELLMFYKHHQINLLNERLQMEYSMLIEQTEICDEDLEILLLPDPINPTEAHFVIRIAGDYSKLPKKIIGDSNNIAIMLHVVFQGVNWQRVTPQIFFSSNLIDILGNPNNLNIPPFPPTKTLMDYVPEIKRTIDNKINGVVENYEKKKEYINALLCIQGCSIIEYDADDFSMITLLMEVRDFHFLVYINLSLKFPTDSPKIILQSIYHLNTRNGNLFKETLTNIPYSPRWSPIEMVSKALMFIIHKSLEFKKNSTHLRYF
ncbi:hypothetical protein PV327_008989 [Microctonus hyperodae]|uniref:BRISC and BRCA1-A complex member 2 n=1 Tax=Microctonus hyperodae TaxID=165561 RepID=A0AA39KV94_MICHY|nr:hypothetical protein PV327_008989 [Microctonus hyperodae]